MAMLSSNYAGTHHLRPHDVSRAERLHDLNLANRNMVQPPTLQSAGIDTNRVYEGAIVRGRERIYPGR